MFVEWPIFGASSVDITRAALAARKQGKYMELHNALLAEGKPITSLQQILKIAKSAGLNGSELQQDMNSQAIHDIVKSNRLLAKNLKLIAAPAFVFSNTGNSKFDFVLGQVDAADLLKAISKVRSK